MNKKNKTILYYDCFSGISGDMNLGAMIDLGVKKEYLVKELKKLNLAGWELKISNDSRKGIYGTKADVIIKKHHNNDIHRNYKDIEYIIKSSTLSDKIKKYSLAIFKKIAEAEAKVHHKTIDKIHFHEIGAVDSIIDIVGAAICFNYLNVDIIISSSIELGGGFVICAHGKFPVPAPATVELLKGIPVKTGIVNFETTTPTGAAILATMVHEFNDTIHFKPIKTAYGIGNRDTDIPNVLRVCLGEAATGKNKDTATAFMLECNIDDMNPELYDFVIEKLFEQGAQDVFLTPVIMKKSRPANILSVICNEEDKDNLKKIIFLNTSTLGLREYTFEKTMLDRDFTTVKTKYGEIRIKHSYYKNKKMGSKPEYEDCKKLAKKHGVSIKEIYDSILKSASV